MIRHVQVNVRKTCHLTLASTSSSKTNVKKIFNSRRSSTLKRCYFWMVSSPLSLRKIHFKKCFVCFTNLKSTQKFFLNILKRSQKVFLLLRMNTFAQKWTFYDAKGYCYCLLAIILLFTFLFVSN